MVSPQFHTLHILRQSRDSLALEAIREEDRFHSVVVVWIQDGVLSPPSLPVPAYRRKADVEAIGGSVGEDCLDDRMLAQLVRKAQRVVVW